MEERGGRRLGGGVYMDQLFQNTSERLYLCTVGLVFCTVLYAHIKRRVGMVEGLGCVSQFSL